MMLNQQNKGRLQFLGLLVAFLVPVVSVLLMYRFNWMPAGRSQGVLVQPPRELHIPILQNYQQKLFAAADWHDKWHLVQVSSNGCDQRCLDDLRDMRQIHASLAKDINRLQRVWLINASIPETRLQQIRALYPDLIILQQSEILAKQLLDAGVARMYLVDPLGHLMMRYPDGIASKAIRKDLVRLLQYAWAG